MILTRTRWGLYTVSVGGNLLGAREAGIKVNRIKYGNFMICAGMLGALVGRRSSNFKNNIIDPSAGQLTLMFYALAAAVIGGTAMLGGSGTIIGALLGMIVLGILHDGFNRARHQLEQVPDHPRRRHPARHDRQRLPRPAAERGQAAMIVTPSTEAASEHTGTGDG